MKKFFKNKEQRTKNKEQRTKNKEQSFTKLLLVVMVIFFSTPLLKGQVKVDADGKVNLGTTSSLCPTGYKVYNDGNVYINGSLGLKPGSTLLGPFSIDAYVNYQTLSFVEDAWGDVGMIPDANNYCTVGSAGQQFFGIYGRSLYANFLYVVSDKRLKDNVRVIESPLKKIIEMKGLRYDFISNDIDLFKSDKKKKEIEKLNKNRLGFLAQDLQLILPEAVNYDEDNDKYYIDYNAIIPVLVEAMKEQQAKIETLEARLDKLEGKSQEKSATVFTGSQTIDAANVPTLAQNIPNPFSTSTRIDISLPQTVNNARLYVYNMQGAQIKSFNVSQRGATSVTIEGFTLDAGMYLYTLIADGKEVDTKKMILTK